ncbi:TPA: hypothetical protein DF272_02380 [Candidatus Falkowbacteria bacterium]|nr:hypothetical protein [Candidatus Falkowbacteria bacterium]
MLILVSCPATALAADIFDNHSQVVIRYDKIDWQTYRFYPLMNGSVVPTAYEWAIDNSQVYYSSSAQIFFPSGDHTVSLTAIDSEGNRKYDSVKINVTFWSLHNNYLLWFLYAVVVVMIMYYWLVKIIYAFNRRQVSKEVRVFMDIFDENGHAAALVDKLKRQLVK